MLVAGRGINGNLDVRVRDVRTGRFMAWDIVRPAGINFSNFPVTYNHENSVLTYRMKNLSLLLARTNQRLLGARSYFLSSAGITQDIEFKMPWRDDDTHELGVWDTYFSGHRILTPAMNTKYVFELYI